MKIQCYHMPRFVSCIVKLISIECRIIFWIFITQKMKEIIFIRVRHLLKKVPNRLFDWILPLNSINLFIHIQNLFMASIISRSCLTSLRNLSSPKYLSLINIRSISSHHDRPLMLMNIPHIAYPNVFLMIKNFFSRIIINGYFDSTFAIKPFSDGARQALTVVSHLIGNGQFDDLPGFVTREVEIFPKLSKENGKYNLGYQ